MANSKFGFRDSTHGNILSALRKVAIQNGRLALHAWTKHLCRYHSYVWWREKMKTKKAKVFWTGTSQAIRLPKEFRFETDAVLVHREERAVIVEPAHDWPDGYAESFAGFPDDFTRPSHGVVQRRTPLR